MVSYDGRTFRVSGQGAANVPQARYHQDGNLVWGEFAGGDVRRGLLAGICSPDGTLDFAYCIVQANGEIVSGRCHSTPESFDDGRIRLNEEWERYAPHADRGVSYLEELDLRISPAPIAALHLSENASMTTTLGDSHDQV
jgi:hypothetical protein